MFTNMLTIGHVNPWIPSQLCMHMGGVQSEEMANLVKRQYYMKFWTSFQHQTSYTPCLPWFLHSLLLWVEALSAVGFEKEPWRVAIMAKF